MKCISLTPNQSPTLTSPNPKKPPKIFNRLSAGPQMTVTCTQAPVASAPSACDPCNLHAAPEGLLERNLLFFAFLVLKLQYDMQFFVSHTVIGGGVRRTARAQSAFKVEQR